MSMKRSRSVSRPAQFKKKARFSSAKARPQKSLNAKVNELLRDRELKWLDTSITALAQGLIAPINNVPLGDDSVSRDGRKIVIKSIQLRYGLAGTAAASATATPRVVIVYDTNPNGVLPVFGDIFTDATGTSFQNLNNRERFKVIYDMALGQKKGSDSFVTVGTGGGGAIIFNDVVYRKCDLTTVFKDTGSGTIAGTSTGALYVCFLYGSAGTTTGSVCNCRIRFADS